MGAHPLNALNDAGRRATRRIYECAVTVGFSARKPVDIAWQALIERANLTRGQKVLIHAGTGGVGTFAIQLAKHLGGIVATTTSTANVGLVTQLGADVVINYTKHDFSQVLRDYDVVLNSLDKVTLENSLRVLKPGGQLISISGSAGRGVCAKRPCRLAPESDHRPVDLQD